MGKINVSVVIPAHKEEKYVESCIASIKEAAEHFGCNVEIIVFYNRFTDRQQSLQRRAVQGCCITRTDA